MIQKLKLLSFYGGQSFYYKSSTDGTHGNILIPVKYYLQINNILINLHQYLINVIKIEKQLI